MGAHEEDGRQDDPGAGRQAEGAQPEAEQGDEGDADLGELPGDEGVILAVAVGEEAGEGAEEGPGGVEEDGHEADGLGLVEGAAVDGEEHGRGVDGLVVEGGQELGRQQGDERPRT